MAASSTDHRRILSVLRDHGVEFVVVGGVAAVLHGAPLVTFDLDIVHARDAANVERLKAALAALDARSRLHVPGIVRVDETHLRGPGHVLLTTAAGDLDVLESVGAGRGHADLVGGARSFEVEPGLVVKVADLEALIELKQEAGRAKDVAELPLLRAVLAERQRTEG